MGSIKIGDKEFPPEEVIVQAKRAPGTLGLIAGLSAVNSVLVFFGAEVSFIVGLGATAVCDGILMVARDELEGGPLMALSLIILAFNAAIIGVFLLLWWLSRRGSRPAYIIACVLYALDSLIYLGVGDWMGVGFHVFFLFLLFAGYNFVKRRAEAEVMLADGGGASSVSEPPPLESPPAEEPDSDFDIDLDELWNALPEYRARAQAAVEASPGEDYDDALAKLTFAESIDVSEWSADHMNVIQHQMAICAERGDSEAEKNLTALGLGRILGLHAAEVIDDAAYHESVRALDDFVDRLKG